MICSIVFNAKWPLKIKSLNDLRVKAAGRSEAALDLTGDCQKLNLATAGGRATTIAHFLKLNDLNF
jgi:hypothetical protein